MKRYPLFFLLSFVFGFYSLRSNAQSLISIFAGGGTATGDSGLATSASIGSTQGICADSAGNVYFVEESGCRVRKVDTAGIIYTVAGTGACGYSGDGGAATSAELWPYGLSCDKAGNLLIGDWFNNRIRRVDAATGIITTIAGTGTGGYSGDGDSAISAELSEPIAACADLKNNIYISDYGNGKVRKIDGTTGIISTVATVGSPDELAVRWNGDVYIASQSGAIYKLDTSGTLTMLCGYGPLGTASGVHADSASLAGPEGVAIDCYGNVVIADNDNEIVREIDSVTGIITTIAGGSTATVTDIGKPPLTVYFHNQLVCFDPAGNLYVTDDEASYVFKITNVSTCGPLAIECDTAFSSTGISKCALINNMILHAPIGFSKYTWNTNDTTSSIAVNDTDTYWVKNTNTCVMRVDTFHLINSALSYTASTTEPTFCSFDSITLDASSAFASHKWNTGDTTAFINIHTGGTYWVVDTNINSCSELIDTFNVTALPPDIMLHISDSALCYGNNMILNAPLSYSSYIWNTGAMASNITVSAAGNYWVSDTNFSSCSVSMDTFKVNAVFPGIVPLINDSTFCYGTSIILNAPLSYTSVFWNIGATTSNITVSATGNYWVCDTNFSSCSIFADTFKVAAVLPVINATKSDSTFCYGNSIVLNAPSGYTTDIWNTDVSVSYITVSTAGIYWVTDTDLSTCKIFTDTFNTTTTLPLLTSLKNDTAICHGNAVTFITPPDYTAHIWNTGAITDFITTGTAGTYWVTDTNLTICAIFIDTFNLVTIPLPVVSLGNDTFICPGDSIILSSMGTIGSYLWNTGSRSPYITEFTGGTFYLTVTSNGCSASDSIHVAQLSAPPVINLGPDTILCKGDQFILNSGTDSSLWSTGIIAADIFITDPGAYWATVTNACGISTDTVTIDFQLCDIFFPSAFTPNNDGKNDIARVVGNLGRYRDYSLSIYNRYGQRVFYTEDIYSGWDGTFNGGKADIGTYFYMIYYTLEDKQHMMKGDLTLIR